MLCYYYESDHAEYTILQMVLIKTYIIAFDFRENIKVMKEIGEHIGNSITQLTTLKVLH